jgi:hypothetical protein
MLKEYDRETISEEVFSTVFTGLEHEGLELSKIKTLNSALAKFVQWT